MVLGIGCRIPQQPPIRTVLAAVAILEDMRLPASSHGPVLLQRALAVVRMHELDERLRHQLRACEPERPLPRGIEPLEVAGQIEAAEQIDRDVKKPLLELA